MSGHTYYVRRGKKTVGPLTGKQVGDGIRSQKFKGSDAVCTKSDGEFTKLGTVYREVVAGSWAGEPKAVAVVAEPAAEDGWLDDLPDTHEAVASMPPIAASPTATASPAESPSRGREKPLKLAENDGTGVLICGIAGFFVPVLLPVAWIMGNGYVSECELRNREPGSSGKTGRRIGKVMTFLWAAVVAVPLVLFVVIPFMLVLLAGLIGVANPGASDNLEAAPPASAFQEAIEVGDYEKAEALVNEMGVTAKAKSRRWLVDEIAESGKSGDFERNMKLLSVDEAIFRGGGLDSAGLASWQREIEAWVRGKLDGASVVPANPKHEVSNFEFEEWGQSTEESVKTTVSFIFPGASGKSFGDTVVFAVEDANPSPTVREWRLLKRPTLMDSTVQPGEDSIVGSIAQALATESE